MEQNIASLFEAYNLLATISTSGEDTLKMAKCLTDFRQQLLLLRQNYEVLIQQIKNTEEE